MGDRVHTEQVGRAGLDVGPDDQGEVRALEARLLGRSQGYPRRNCRQSRGLSVESREEAGSTLWGRR